MKNKYKVFGGLTFKDGKQVRCIIATKTKKRAIELLKITPFEFNNYWCDTGNDIECEVALESPETVFISINHYSKSKSDYKAIV